MTTDTATDDWLWTHDDEQVRWRGRPRLTAIADSVAAGVLVVLVAIGLAAAVDARLAALAVLGLPIPVWGYFRVKRTTYCVTTRAVWLKTGVVGRSVRRVTLSRVQNTAYSQSIRGSLFGYGSVTVEVAGGPDVRFRRINDPRDVQETITELIGPRRERTIPGSVDQWQAVLGAVREIRAVIESG